MTTTLILQLVASGIAFGSLYAMVAVGFNIIYNTTGIINFAQGEFAMLGGMLIVWAHKVQGYPLPAAFVFAIAVVTLVGVAVERLTIHPLKKPSVLVLILITIWVSFFLQGAALKIWGAQSRFLSEFTPGESVDLWGVRIGRQSFWVWGSLAAISVALALFFSKTMAGKAMRACAANREAATLVGINAKTMVLFSFALSAAIGALGGAVMTPISNVVYTSGSMWGLKGFLAAVLGGLGNTFGAVGAGILLGIFESLSAGLISSHYKDAIALGIMVVILFVRPSGIFGSKQAGSLKEH
jgi:branched-chain amino acid transport system permease protein